MEPLTSAQLVAVRRYMGFSVSGNTTSLPYREPVYSNETLASLSLDYRLANLSCDEQNVITTYFLPNLVAREADIQAAAVNLDTDTAAVWKHNPQEIVERRALYTALRIELCDFLGFAPGRGIMRGSKVVRA